MLCNPRLFLPIFRRMQSFFVASGHFSVQNRCMQEQNEEKTEKKPNFIKRIGWRNWIFSGLFFGILVTSAAGLLYLYRDLPTSAWGHYNDTMPWRGYECELSSVKTGWSRVVQDKETAYYVPTIELTLGNSPGSGDIQITLYDDMDRECYKIENIRYQNGQFIISGDLCVDTTQQQAKITCVVSNPLSEVDMKIYGTSKHARPWKALVTHTPVMADRPFQAPQTFRLGEATISAKCLSVIK